MEAPGEKKPIVGAVEVQKDADARMWYNASVLDLVGKEKLLVKFEGDVWPKEEFPFSRVRKLPKYGQAELDKFHPRIGDEVELRVNPSEHHPGGWAIAVVKNIKHTFFFVTRSGNSKVDGNSEAIVEKIMLRPVVVGSSLGSQRDSLKQESFKFAPGLLEWVATEDALGCFARVESDSGLMFIKIGRSELKLVGDEKSVSIAKKLLDVHQKHQQTIQMHMEKRERRLTALEKRRNQIEGTGYQHSIEITIEPGFVRRVIGTKGEAIRAVMQKYDVNIHIHDPESNNADEPRIVRIFGNSLDNIELARGEVEFIEEAYPEPVDPGMFAWIRGRGGRTINQVKELTGIVYVRMDRDSRQLMVCGTRNAVEDAMALFETHIMYYPVFSQMDEEMEELVKQLEEYGDYTARREWGWYRDEDDEGYGGKSASSKSGKSKGKGSKGSNGKDRADSSWKDGKESKGKGSWKDEEEPKGKGSKAGKHKEWSQDWTQDWEEEERKPSRSSKGSGKSQSKSSSGKGTWREVRHEEEETREEAWADAPARGRGRGRHPRTETSKASDDSSAPAAPKPAANRKMGKKGIRH